MSVRKIDLLSIFLKKKRLLAGLSQVEVAKKLGYSSPQFISNWERGISDPPISTLKKLAEIYRISIDEIFDITLEVNVKRLTEQMRKKFKSLKNFP